MSEVAMVITDQGFMQHVLDLVSAADEFAEADPLWQAVREAECEVYDFGEANDWPWDDPRYDAVDEWFALARDRQSRAVSELFDVCRGQ